MNPMETSVVIVDDHAGFRAAAQKMLEDRGFNVIGTASSGFEALAEVERLHPHVVVLDIQLPDIDGIQVAARLALLPISPDVVLTSSRDATDYGVRLDGASSKGFLPKGEFSAAALIQVLDPA